MSKNQYGCKFHIEEISWESRCENKDMTHGKKYTNNIEYKYGTQPKIPQIICDRTVGRP